MGQTSLIRRISLRLDCLLEQARLKKREAFQWRTMAVEIPAGSSRNVWNFLCFWLLNLPEAELPYCVELRPSNLSKHLRTVQPHLAPALQDPNECWRRLLLYVRRRKFERHTTISRSVFREYELDLDFDEIDQSRIRIHLSRGKKIEVPAEIHERLRLAGLRIPVGPR